jgi:hypothetical protein
MTAPTLDRERLAKLCGMFGSDHPGERANAAAAADKLIRAAGLRWPDVLKTTLPLPPRVRPVDTVADTIAFLLQHADALTDWEHDFVRSVAAQRYPFSAKQIEVLRRLVDKLQRAGARAA